MPTRRDSKPSLCQLLLSTANRDATVEQDRVFAVLALAQDGRVDQIDYRKSVKGVFVDAAKMCLGVVDNHDIPIGVNLQLLLNIERTSNIVGLPSWVPDYRLRKDFVAMASSETQVVSWTQPRLNNVHGFCDGRVSRAIYRVESNSQPLYSELRGKCQSIGAVTISSP